MHQNSESSDASIGEVSYGAAIQLHHLQVATASSSGCRRGLARDAMAKLVTSVAYSFSLPFSVVLFINSSPVTCTRSAGVSAAGLPKQLSGLSISSLLALSLG